jgi:acylphosphatase
MQSIKYIIFGKVQKVGFRHHFSKLAKSYNLKGYVKNLSDGTVEILLQESTIDIKKLLNDLTTNQPQISISSYKEEKVDHSDLKEFLII